MTVGTPSQVEIYGEAAYTAADDGTHFDAVYGPEGWVNLAKAMAPLHRRRVDLQIWCESLSPAITLSGDLLVFATAHIGTRSKIFVGERPVGGIMRPFQGRHVHLELGVSRDEPSGLTLLGKFRPRGERLEIVDPEGHVHDVDALVAEQFRGYGLARAWCACTAGDWWGEVTVTPREDGCLSGLRTNLARHRNMLVDGTHVVMRDETADPRTAPP